MIHAYTADIDLRLITTNDKLIIEESAVCGIEGAKKFSAIMRELKKHADEIGCFVWSHKLPNQWAISFIKFTSDRYVAGAPKYLAEPKRSY